MDGFDRLRSLDRHFFYGRCQEGSSMDIGKNVSEVRQALKEDTGEGTKTLLAQIETEFATMQDSLKRINSENKTKREALNELQISTENLISEKDLEVGKLKKQIETLSDDSAISNLQAEHTTKVTEFQTKLETLSTENESLKNSQTELNKIFRTDFINDFNGILENDNFEKVSKLIKMPKKSEDGKFDFTELTDEDIQFNKGKFSEFITLGLFTIAGQANQNTNVPVVEKFEGNVDIVKLAKSDPVAARKYLDKKRNRNQLFK